MKNKICAIIVTYNPCISELENNIKLILPQVDTLFLFDNGSGNATEIKDINHKNNFQAFFNRENVGLGHAYNSILSDNLDLFEYFVTFDQDTAIHEETIDTLLNVLKRNSDIGILGPVFSRERSSISKNGNLIYKTAIIQSCAIFRSSAATEVGIFNEDYFIDSVDFEYCLRMMQKGYKVGLFDGVKIQHNLGEQKKFLGMGFYSHNKIRNYYIARNHIDLTKKYLTKFPLFIFKKNIFFVLHIAKVLFLERDSEKIKYLWNGIKNNPL